MCAARVLVCKPEKAHWEYLKIDGNIIINLKAIKWGDVDRIRLAWYRDQSQAITDMVMNFRSHNMMGISVSEDLSASQGLSSKS
jgi:hypothetical protein